MNEGFNNKENDINNEENINSTDKNAVEQINENIEDSNVNDNKQNDNKSKQVLIAIIGIIIMLLIVLTIYVVLDKKDNNSNDDNKDNNIQEENKDNNVDNKDNEVNNNEEEDVVEGPVTHKLVKVLGYKNKEDNSKNVKFYELEDYYIIEDENIYFYDKNGKDVTTKIFGNDDIEITDGIYGDNQNDTYIISTSSYKYGLYDKDFNEIIEIGNNVIQRTDNDKYFYVGKDVIAYNSLENVGVYNIKGEIIIPMDYERLHMINNKNKVMFFAKKNGKYGIIDDKNNQIIPIEYDYIPSKGPTDNYVGEVIENNGQYMYILYKNGKYGMVDNNNNVIIDFNKNRLSYSKYANVVLEFYYNNKRVNVYNLNGELKKVIDLDKDNLEYEEAYYYKLDTKDFVFYNGEYIYLLNSFFEFEKYIKPYKLSQYLRTTTYFASNDIYLTSEDGIKFNIYNTKDNSLLFKEEFYLINSNSDNVFVLCKSKSKENSYSNCGIVDYSGKTIYDFKYNTIDGNDSTTFGLLYENEKIEFDYSDDTNKWDMEKKKINGSCVINDKLYAIENNVIVNFDRDVYNSNCTKILNKNTNSYDNVYSLDDNLIMSEKFRTGENNNNLYKIYNISTGKITNIENKDNVIIIDGTIGKTLKNEYVHLTDKGIYKIVEYNE